METIFVDTNIFLHYKLFDQIDWLEVCSSEKCELVIPPIVIDELDKHKIGNTKIGKRARNILGKIEKLYENENFEIQKNVLIKILSDKPKSETFVNNGLNYEEQDHRIFASIIEYKKINPTCSISLMTGDIGPRIRARQYNINVIKPPQKYFIPPSASEEEKQIKKLEEENILLKSRIPDLTLEFENGKEFFKIKKKNKTIEKQSFIQGNLENQKNEFEYLALKENDYENPMNAFLQTFNNLSLSEEQVEKYNKELDEYFDKYENYLNKKWEHLLYKNLSYNISICLLNDGTTPAEDIDIHLHFPDGFDLVDLDDYPSPPEEPKPPYKPKSRFDMEGLGFINYLPDINPTFPSTSKIEINKPSIRKTNSYEVDFQKKYLKHHYRSKLDTLVLIYQNIEDIQNLKIDYIISAANMPDVVRGNLNIIYE